MKLTLRLVGSPKNSPWVAEGATLRLGRDPECEISLGEKFDSVSWRHARIVLSAKGAVVTDLESTNGTYLNDQRLLGAMPLKKGDHLRLGHSGPTLEVAALDLSPSASPGPGKKPGLPETETWTAADAPAGGSQRRTLLLAAGAGAGAVVLAVLVLAVVFWPRGSETAPDSTAAARVALGAKPVLPQNPGVITPPPIVQENGAGPAPPKEHAPAAAPADPGPAKPPEEGAAPSPAIAASGLAQEAQLVLKTYCHKCHGIEFRAEKLDVLNHEHLLKGRDPAAGDPYVTPGNPDKSFLWEMLSESMPPAKNPKPKPAEVETIRKWIAAGAPPFAAPTVARGFVSERDVLTAIKKDQTQIRAANWPFHRYFTLTHLHNSKAVTDQDLALYRAALSKLVNSLSKKSKIILPEAIDEAKTVYRIDTRTLDWDRNNLWQAIVRVYPYALRHDRDRDPGVQRLADEVYRNAGTPMPAVRADWFIANASQPPLYHTLLRIPASATELEAELGVNVALNFHRNELKRAAFNQSGVSKQNRLVERHEARDGFYWKSYDFKKGAARGDLVKFPLGPVFPGNPFLEEAFNHDGGEIIYSLPNGLQAYMLVNGKDVRINEGPTEVVDDPSAFSGTTAIVNGLSCMGCHKDGMRKGFKDMVREGTGVVGLGLQKVLELYPPGNDMDRLLKEDGERFQRAVQEATAPFLDGGQKDSEPITALAGPYLKKDLSLQDVALELGLEDASRLQSVIASNQTLRDLGLGPLAEGHPINRRENWEKLAVVNRGALRGCFSTYQQVALELRLGEPMPLAPP